MKTKIDDLVRGIHADLAQPSPSKSDEVAYYWSICSQHLGVDNLSKAAAKRATIARWAEELSDADEREYARQQHDTLPDF